MRLLDFRHKDKSAVKACSVYFPKRKRSQVTQDIVEMEMLKDHKKKHDQQKDLVKL